MEWHISSKEPHRLAHKPFLDLCRENHKIWGDSEMIAQEDRISIEFFDENGPAGSKRTAAIILDRTTGEVLLVSAFNNYS